jgi:phage tail-like protein
VPEFTVNPQRFDPYKNFKFRVKWDGRYVTQDLEFEQWANKVWDLGAAAAMEVSLKDFRKDVRLELLNEAGQVVMAYNIYRCWVSEYVVLPELDANAGAIAIQHINSRTRAGAATRT